MPTGASISSNDLVVSLQDNDGVSGPEKNAQKRKELSARKNLGIFLLFVVIVLWVSSSFLTHAIFSDDSYSKPYFVTYLNTSVFCLYLIPRAVRESSRWWKSARSRNGGPSQFSRGEYHPIMQEGEQVNSENVVPEGVGKLSMVQTMRLSFEFCLMWFTANYFQSYSLKLTSVASATILSCTSGVFTLILSSVLKIERFTWTKLFSVFLSIAGISLISSLDFGDSPNESPAENTKTPMRILLGDGMALLGALSYGVYTTLLKIRVGDESRVSMKIFFGFVGLFNLLGLWPGLVLLHAAGVEKFELPSDNRVWRIVAINALITLVSDYCWAYAMLLTTPLIVTVGLGLTIPLALLGGMLLQLKSPKSLYWVGATLVFVAFLFISVESEALDMAVGSGEGNSEEEVVTNSP